MTANGQRSRRPNPRGVRLNKRFIATHNGYHFYTVNGYAVRDVAQPDEEFGCFATSDNFSSLIPKGEVWLAEQAVEREGLFFIANALTQLKEQEGAPGCQGVYPGHQRRTPAAGTAQSLEVPRGRSPKTHPQRSLCGPLYATLPDKEDKTVNVWIVDANVVRSLFKTDYVEGGHGFVYPWVPNNEIWLEDTLDQHELPFIVAHEYLERRLMRDEKLDYDTAHDICSRVEFHLRKNQHVKLFLARAEKFRKKDLPKLASDELLQYVVQHHVKTRK